MRPDGPARPGGRQLTAAEALAVLYGAVQAWQRAPAPHRTVERLRAAIDQAITAATTAR